MNKLNLEKEKEKTIGIGEKIFIVACLILFLTILKFSGSNYPTLQASDYKTNKK